MEKNKYASAKSSTTSCCSSLFDRPAISGGPLTASLNRAAEAKDYVLPGFLPRLRFRAVQSARKLTRVGRACSRSLTVSTARAGDYDGRAALPRRLSAAPK
jgi:hypothetical protein